MRLQIEKYKGLNDVTDVDNMLKMLQAIKNFVNESIFNQCTILSINDDSVDDHGRIDIELQLQQIDYEKKVVHRQAWQKVFFINGEILDCPTYAHRYLEA